MIATEPLFLSRLRQPLYTQYVRCILIVTESFCLVCASPLYHGKEAYFGCHGILVFASRAPPTPPQSHIQEAHFGCRATRIFVCSAVPPSIPVQEAHFDCRAIVIFVSSLLPLYMQKVHFGCQGILIFVSSVASPLYPGCIWFVGRKL